MWKDGSDGIARSDGRYGCHFNGRERIVEKESHGRERSYGRVGSDGSDCNGFKLSGGSEVMVLMKVKSG